MTVIDQAATHNRSENMVTSKMNQKWRIICDQFFNHEISRTQINEYKVIYILCGGWKVRSYFIHIKGGIFLFKPSFD